MNKRWLGQQTENTMNENAKAMESSKNDQFAHLQSQLCVIHNPLFSDKMRVAIRIVIFATSPTISTGAEEAAALALLQHIGHYGAPAEIQSDRGTQFINDTIQYLLVKRMGIEWIRNHFEWKSS